MIANFEQLKEDAIRDMKNELIKTFAKDNDITEFKARVLLGKYKYDIDKAQKELIPRECVYGTPGLMTPEDLEENENIMRNPND